MINRNFIIKSIFLVILAGFFIGGLSYCSINSPSTVKNGTLDLSKHSFDKDGTLALNGDWEFYPNQFVSPNQKQPEPYLLMPVPDIWNNYKINGQWLQGFGYATYRLHVSGAPVNESLGLKILPQSTAYQLYVDDRLLVQSGQISAYKTNAPVQYITQTVFFTPEQNEFTLTMYISNHIYARGGMWDAPTLGTARQIAGLDQLVAYRDWFLLGNYFIMFLLCLVIFLIRPGNRSVLYFALLCFIATGRVLLYGEHLILYLTDSFHWITVIEFLTIYWYPVLLVLFVEAQFPGTTHKKLVKGLTFVIAVASLVTLLVPISTFTAFTGIVRGYDLLIGFYIIAVLLIRCQAPFKWALLLGICIIFLSSIYDMWFSPTAFIEVNVVGFYLMLLIFALVLVFNYTRALKTTQLALRDFKISSERERQAQLKFLQSQIKPNFLYHSLAAIANICSRDAQKAEELILDLAFFLQASFDFTGFDRMSTLGQELELVKNYIHIEKARFENKISYHEQINVPLHVQLPRLVLQPLVENAVCHGIAPREEGGEIWLKAYANDTGIQIEIGDNGVGIDQEAMAGLLDIAGDNPGIGLKNINERLIRIYGQGLSIESKPNCWTQISFVIIKRAAEPNSIELGPAIQS